MALDTQDDLDFSTLWDTPKTVVSRTPPVADVSVSYYGDRPSEATGEYEIAGEIVLTVRGFSVEDHIELSRKLYRCGDAYNRVAAAVEAQKKEINPAGKADQLGEKLASDLAIGGPLGKWRNIALSHLTTAAREICFLGVIGWQPGALKYKGQDVPFVSEDRLILGKQRPGLASLPLGLLQSAGCVVSLARKILQVSDGETPREAAKEVDPLALAATPETSPKIAA